VVAVVRTATVEAESLTPTLRGRSNTGLSVIPLLWWAMLLVMRDTSFNYRRKWLCTLFEKTVAHFLAGFGNRNCRLPLTLIPHPD
jgi:hypothetical protein